MKRVVVLQSNYVPWKGYFDLVHDADVFVFYDESKYTKNDWRNRNRIVSANGAHWLTIPIAHDAVKLKINEVTINDAYWQEKHLKSLVESYRKAPYFAQLEPFLDEFYARKKWTHLSELNRAFTEKIARFLGLQTVFKSSKDFGLSTAGPVARLLEVLDKAGATEYITGPSARDYLEEKENDFAARGITLRYKDYAGYPEYPQLGPRFEHAVSILDLIANVPQARIPDYIWAWRKVPTLEASR